jgi:hypothetical protein
MKRISSSLYVVEPGEVVTITIEAVNTPLLVSVSLDGKGFALQPGSPITFTASLEKGTTHYLVLFFSFAEPANGVYKGQLHGEEGGTFTFSASQGPSQTESLELEFRVGSLEAGKLGIDPPNPWPHG